MTNKTVLLIDGDLIAYRMAAGGEARSVEVTYKPTGSKKTFNTRTEFKNFLKEKDVPFHEDKYSFQDVQEPVDFIQIKKSVRRIITDLQDITWADHTEVYVGSPDQTFRHSLPLPTMYKDNRSAGLKPVHLLDCKNYMVDVFKAKWSANNLETDDIVNIRAYEELAKGNRPIIATIDKDSYQSNGIVILNWMDKPFKQIEIPLIGSLTKVNTQIKGDGLKFLAYQTIAGDPVDVYCPYDLSQIKYGPSKAMKSLNNTQTAEEILEVIVKEYRKLYPTPINYMSWNGVEMVVDWKFLLQMYWKCSYMKRSWDDDSSIWTFFSKQGVNVDKFRSL